MTAPVQQAAVPPRWAWVNLTEAEAQDLDVALTVWVDDWNRNLALDTTQVIPACWRQHPGITQELPVMFHLWDYVHRNPQATVLEAADFYTRTVPAFRDRLAAAPGLFGGAGGDCRAGKHPPPGAARAKVLDLAATDTAARGPDNLGVLRGTTFGT